MKNSLLILLAFVFSIATSFCQKDTYDEYTTYAKEDNQYVVIAMSGLKLREKPSFDAPSMITMPLGSKVKVIFGRLYESMENETTERFVSDEKAPDNIGGYWVQVEFKSKKGWCFAPYLGKGILKMNKPLYFFMEGAGCAEMTYISSNYHYYGVFDNEFKAIKPIFYSHEEGTEIRASGSRRPQYIIVSKEPMTEGVIESVFNQQKKWLSNNPKDYDYVMSKPLRAFDTKKEPNAYFPNTLVYNVKLQFSTDWWLKTSQKKGKMEEGESEARMEATIKITDGKITQKLLTQKQPGTLALYWEGDIDRDGRPDFIISEFAEGEGSNGYHLYLSRLAKPNELVGLAGVWDVSDCC